MIALPLDNVTALCYGTWKNVKHRAIAHKYRTLNEILISESIYKYSIGYIPFTHVIFKKKKKKKKPHLRVPSR